MKETTEDFGSYLKHERKLRGVSLEEIASSTKVHIRYLRALEDNNYDDLPGEVFIKGFIRSYSKAIGANEEDLLSAYDESVGRERHEKIQKEIEEQENADQRKKMIQKNSLVLMVAVLIVSGVVYFVFSKSNKPSTQARTDIPVESSATTGPVMESSSSGTESGETLEGLVSVPEDSVEETPDPSNSPEENSKPTERIAESVKKEKKPELKNEIPEIKKSPKVKIVQKDPPPPVTPKEETQEETIEEPKVIKKEEPEVEQAAVSQPVQVDTIDLATELKPIKLVIQVNETSWFNLRVDKENELDFILPAGTSKTFQANNAIRMTIGNKRGTELIVNEQKLDLPETPDNVIRNFIVSEDILG